MSLSTMCLPTPFDPPATNTFLYASSDVKDDEALLATPSLIVEMVRVLTKAGGAKEATIATNADKIKSRIWNMLKFRSPVNIFVCVCVCAFLIVFLMEHKGKKGCKCQPSDTLLVP
mmetsp:Transcript_1134/g.1853  ORF Transcript_1134/g.1853 Transcript_1134/m.1853 type:complete len:116 (+) Transcript_1134:672-1019(+)